MYNNLGTKLRICAIILAILGGIGTIIALLVLASLDIDGFILYIIAGIFAVLLSSWSLYALGNLEDATDEIYSQAQQNAQNINRLSKELENIAKKQNVILSSIEENKNK